MLVETGVAAPPTSPGFGLLGHGLEMARASGTRFVFDAAALPALDGALDLAIAGVETGGAAHNRRFVAPGADRRAMASRRSIVTLAHDPQTSGGLLAAVSPSAIATLEAGLDARGVTHWQIGHVEPSAEGHGAVALR